ncbi:MAG: hypothetical protein ACD_11C00001G0002 [uncultured bacterium]|nr:MAG: hypothetical protein ACD_11C00001G0002 [uncultured bacterium]
MEKNSDPTPSPVVEIKKDNGSRTEKLKSKAEDSETLSEQIDLEMNELDILIGELTEEFEFFATENNLSGKEKTKQSKKVLGVFKSDIIKVGKRRDNDAKLAKIKEIQEKIKEKINGYILEEENEEDFNDLVLATNKCLEDLRKKYDQFILNNNLSEDEKPQFNQFISEYNERIKVALAEKNKKELEEIGYDIKANLESDIIIEDEEVESGDDKKVEKEIFNRELIMKDFNSFFDELRRKFIKFEKVYKGSDKESCEKLERNIKYWAGKIKNFESIEIPGDEDIKKIMQLHDEIKKWTEESWTELHRAGKFELTIHSNQRNLKKKSEDLSDSKNVLQDLDHIDLHGIEIPAIKSVEEIEQEKKIFELEEKFGKPGTIYARDDKKTGFPIDSFEIVGYELGDKDVDTFVAVKKLVDDEEIETKIDLERFKKDKIYVRVAEDVDEDAAGEGAIETEEDILSAKEISELVALVKEIKEEKGNLDIDKIELNKKFKDFLLAHKDEKEFNKGLLKAIHLLEDRFAEIDRKFRQMNVDGQANQELLDEIKKLDSEMIAIIDANWEEELEKFKELKDIAEAGLLKFTDKEKSIVEKSNEIVAGFIEDFRKDFDWDNFPKKKIDEFLDIQAIAFLMETFTSKKWFIGNEENVAEFIIKNRNKTK